MNILITGASGFIGRHVLQTCVERGHQVTACVRSPQRLQRHYPSVSFLQCDFSKDHYENSWLPRITGIDVVINAVGIYVLMVTKLTFI